jgi:hypothetical protein
MKYIKSFLINIGIFVIIFLILFGIGEVIARTVFTTISEGPTAVNLQIFEANDSYVWGHLPGAIDHHGYENPTPEIRINNLGFRDDELSQTKPENTKLILALGDSFTFGMGIRQENIFTEKLEKILTENDTENTYEVVNMGAIGYTLDQELLILKEKGLELNPDAVIVNFFTGNDVTEFGRHEWVLDDNEEISKVLDTKHYVDEEHRLRYKGENEPVSYFANFVYTRWRILSKKLGLSKEKGPTLTWPAYLDPDDEHGDPNLPEYWYQVEFTLTQMKRMLDEKGIKLIVVAIPMDVQTDKKFWNKYPEMYFDNEAYELSRPQANMKQLTDMMKIEYIDLLPFFREADPNLWYYYEKEDPHWTNEGHLLAAETIANNLQL